MRALPLIRNACLAVFFLLLVGGVILQPGKKADSASAAPTQSDDGGVNRAS
jgi:hypothetical protein